MSLAAKISSAEIRQQINSAYVGNYLEVALCYLPGFTYEPGAVNDGTFLLNYELPSGVAGYKRQIIGYSSSDVSLYADKGIGLSRKAAVFTHDGGTEPLGFSHICLVRSTGNVISFVDPPTATPTGAVDGTYTNLPTISNGSGSELLVNLTVSDTGTVFVTTVGFPGYNHEVGDVITVQEADLVSAGVCEIGAGNLVLTVASITESPTNNLGGSTIYSVTKPNTDVVLTDGRQAVIYFDIKHFGFFN